MAIKLTKNELKKQKDNLKQFQRYLPTLQLKKQQLQTVIMGIRAELERKEAERIQMIGDLDDWVAVFAENELFEEKKRLEEKQRAARKNRSKSEEDWKTRWFHQGPNPYSGAQDWIYSGSYWDRNYFNLPDIY